MSIINKFIPTKRQFLAWSLPSKCGYVAIPLSIIGIIITLFLDYQKHHENCEIFFNDMPVCDVFIYDEVSENAYESFQNGELEKAKLLIKRSIENIENETNNGLANRYSILGIFELSTDNIKEALVNFEKAFNYDRTNLRTISALVFLNINPRIMNHDDVNRYVQLVIKNSMPKTLQD